MALLQPVNNVFRGQLLALIEYRCFHGVIHRPYDFRLAQAFRRVDDFLPRWFKDIHRADIGRDELFNLHRSRCVEFENLVVTAQ